MLSNFLVAQGIARLSHIQLFKALRALHNNLAFTKFSNPHKFWHGFKKFMNIFIPSYFLIQIIPEMKFEGFSEASKSKPSFVNK